MYYVLRECTACSSMFYAQNPAFEIVHQQRELEGLYTHVRRERSAEPSMSRHPASLRIFLSLPGSRLRLFITVEIQYSDEHTFVQQYTLYAQNLVLEIVNQ